MSPHTFDNVAGRLNTRLTLQEVVSTSDGAGGFSRIWQNVTDLWAEMIPIAGKEVLNALQPTADVTYKLLLRYRNDLSIDKRFLLGERVFNIRSVLNIDNRGYLLEVVVEENVGS